VTISVVVSSIFVLYTRVFILQCFIIMCNINNFVHIETMKNFVLCVEFAILVEVCVVICL